MKKKLQLLKTISILLFAGALAACNNQKCNPTSCSCEEQPSSATSHSSQAGGYEDGYVDGYVDGFADGKTSGYEDGYEEGKTDGYNEGYQDGASEHSEESGVDYRSIHTELQLEYLKGADYKTVPTGVNGSQERSKPVPLTITIPESPLYDLSDIRSATLRISEDENVSTYKEVTGENNSFVIKNVKINTAYYYYYFFETSRATFFSEIREVFIKNEAPRMLDIGGVTNARDVGGWKIKGGQYTEQGLMFRMARLHYNATMNITREGIASFQELGIKTEIDLRYAEDGNTVYESPVPGVTYYNCPINYNNSFFDDADNRVAIKDAFELMANKQNYPLMFHCSIGTDRTGFISFILNALAGVQEECLYQDYLMSNFGQIGGSRDSAQITYYINTLRSTYRGGNDLSLGAQNYMTGLGLDETSVNTIKGILLGEINPLE